jgi:hypothetical protein
VRWEKFSTFRGSHDGKQKCFNSSSALDGGLEPQIDFNYDFTSQLFVPSEAACKWLLFDGREDLMRPGQRFLMQIDSLSLFQFSN